MLFLLERRRNAAINAALAERVKAAELRADEERQNADEERKRADEARQNADEERRRANEARQNADEERKRADEARQRAEQRMEEQHQAMMALIAKMSDAIDRNRKPAP